MILQSDSVLNGPISKFLRIFIATILLAYYLFTGVVIADDEINIDCDAKDAWLAAGDADYLTAHDKSSAGFIDTSNVIVEVGQQLTVGGTYYVHRSFLFFDTTSLSTNAILTKAAIRFHDGDILYHQEPFGVHVLATSGTPNWSTGAKAADFNKIYYSGSSCGYIDSEGINRLVIYDIDLNQTGLDAINSGTTTIFALRSDNDINSATPTVAQFMEITSADAGFYPGSDLIIQYVYPDEIDASSDDAQQRLSGPFTSTTASTAIIANAVDVSRYASGFRWQLPIPKGATINTAYCELYFNDAGFDDINCTISAHDSDDAPAFSVGSETDVISRTTTSASVSWAEDGVAGGGVGYYGSDKDLSTVIQEVIDRDGWEYNNHLALLYNPTTVGGKIATVNAQDAGSNVPRLVVSYTAWEEGSVNSIDYTGLYKINGVATGGIKTINGVGKLI